MTNILLGLIQETYEKSTKPHKTLQEGIRSWSRSQREFYRILSLNRLILQDSQHMQKVRFLKQLVSSSSHIWKIHHHSFWKSQR